MTQIQIYKKNVSLAEKKAHIQQQASIQSNNIDLENLDAMEALIDNFVDMCNNKAKLVCKYSPEELRNRWIKERDYAQYKWQKNMIGEIIVSYKDHISNYINAGFQLYEEKYLLPDVDYVAKNFNTIIKMLAKDPADKFSYLHKAKFDKYDLIDFNNLHILTDVSLENFVTQEYNNIVNIKEIGKKLFPKTDSNKLANNEKKYDMLKSIYANSTYHKLEEFKERVAESKGGNIEWKCNWVKEMDYAVFLKLYKMLYKEFNLNTMESLVKETTINMKCLEENLRYIVMFNCGKNV